MKLKHIIFGLLMMVGFCGCTDDDEPTMLEPIFELNRATEVKSNSAVISGNITSRGGVVVGGVVYSASSDAPTIEGGGTVKTAASSNFSVTLTGLAPNTVYYYRLYAKSDLNTAYSSTIYSFTTGGN